MYLLCIDDRITSVKSSVAGWGGVEGWGVKFLLSSVLSFTTVLPIVVGLL